ncbi:MAG: response regulator [Candidatus Omnitrophota bacterium]
MVNKKGNPQKTILTIEDTPSDQRFIQRVLEKDGYKVLTADNGKSGLRIAKAQKPDLIILDEILPDIRGTEVCGLLKIDAETHNIPVLFLTVVDDPKNILGHFEMDVMAHLTKPIKAEDLLKQIQAVLER